MAHGRKRRRRGGKGIARYYYGGKSRDSFGMYRFVVGASPFLLLLLLSSFPSFPNMLTWLLEADAGNRTELGMVVPECRAGRSDMLAENRFFAAAEAPPVP